MGLKKYKRKHCEKYAIMQRERSKWDWRKGQAVDNHVVFCNLLVIPQRELSWVSDLSKEMLFSAGNLQDL